MSNNGTSTTTDNITAPRPARKAVKKRTIYNEYRTVDEESVRLVIHEVIDPVRAKKHYVLAVEADEIRRRLNGEQQ